MTGQDEGPLSCLSEEYGQWRSFVVISKVSTKLADRTLFKINTRHICLTQHIFQEAFSNFPCILEEFVAANVITVAVWKVTMTTASFPFLVNVQHQLSCQCRHTHTLLHDVCTSDILISSVICAAVS